MEVNEIWYGHYAICDNCRLMILNFLHLVIPTRQLLEFMRLNDDDATTHDLLHMCITDLTKPNLTEPNLFKSDVHLRAFYNENGWMGSDEI
jgi:hypothetical protein